MPYLSIVQAAEATGKSPKTIRRLISKPESQSFITREGEGANAPVLIDSSYLASVYPMSLQAEGTDTPGKEPRHGSDTDSQNDQAPPQSEMERDFIAFLKEEVRKRDEQLAMKDRRIEDLTEKLTSIKLLTEGEPAEKSKSRKWWPW
ncbi:hypothetical protein ACD591_21135 [Rufibacter glacialis]|uniref:Uncharacterized protein n=2 Tax=Rufibacter glacialis TaxID=1259555 RepID=A0A5M8QT44_9BACT|nr:hypothetical protein [Rufibacter glacialis]KAA6438034.1 hypothetical protein FOE74_00825 [Rufibacter glacialis]